MHCYVSRYEIIATPKYTLGNTIFLAQGFSMDLS